MTAAKERGQSPWKDKPPPERAWKRRTGTSPTEEQNRAAGGRHRRTVDLGDGRYACASVSLRVWAKTRRIRAFLRWSDNGNSPEIPLGEVEHGTRRANLVEAWERAWERGLMVEEPAPSGSWASSAATPRFTGSRTPGVTVLALGAHESSPHRRDASPTRAAGATRQWSRSASRRWP